MTPVDIAPNGEPVTLFCILTTQRSGSTMLVRRLRRHPAITCHHEAFMHRNRRGYSYARYWHATPGRRAVHVFVPSLSAGAYLDHLVTRFKGSAVGFKLMYNHLQRTPGLRSALHRRGARVVHLVRANLLKRLVSARVAEARDLWVANAPVEIAMRIHLPTDNLLDELERSAETIDLYRRRFRRFEVLEVSYEDLVAGEDAERSILRFLSVDELVPLSTDSVKLNPERVSDIVENYAEVERVLRGTAYERFLD